MNGFSYGNQIKINQLKSDHRKRVLTEFFEMHTQNLLPKMIITIVFNRNPNLVIVIVSNNRNVRIVIQAQYLLL